MSTTFVSGVDGDPIYAKRAEEDQYGNNIDQTYAKKTDIPDDTEFKFTDMVVFGYPSFSESVTTAVSTYSDFYYDTRKIAGHRIQVVYQNNNADQGMQYPEIAAYDENGTRIFFTNWAATYGTTTRDASIPSGAVKLHIRVPRYCRASFTWTCIDPINDRVASIRSSDNSVNVSTSDGVADITLPGDVVRDSNYTHIDAGTANPLMDGTASAGTSVKYAREDHVHPSDTSREAVANKTTVVLGDSDSKYPTDKAVANFVNSSIATNTAYYISDNGEPFTSVEELEAYPGIVTNNDYAFVTGTDSAGNTYYDRYKATVRDSTVTWALEYRLNNSSFTAAQWAAINSGITAALVAKIHEHANKAVLDGITATDVSNWNDKMDKQTAGNASTPIYLIDGTATPCGTLTGRVLSDKVTSGNNNYEFYKILSISNQTDSISKSGVVVPWIGRSAFYPFHGELHICTANVGVTNWITSSYNLFYSSNDHSSRPQFFIAVNDTNGIDLYVVLRNYSAFVWAPTATATTVVYVNEKVDALPENAVRLTDRVNASLSAWSVGSASTPVYFSNGVAQEATSIAAATASEAASGSTLESKINSKQDDLGISPSGSSTKFLNEQGEWTTVTTPDVSNKLDKDGLGDDVRVQFTQATTRTNIVTTSKLSVLFGKIQKWFADMGVLAFKDKVGVSDVESGTYPIGISGNAASAGKLAFPRNIHVDLESNIGVNFDGSANIAPGVKGVLPQAFGGTGSDTVDAQPTEGSNNMVTSGGVWDFSAPAHLGILTGADASPGNNFDRFVVLVTGSVRLQLDWLRKKSGRVIEFYNLNDYEIPINIVFKHSDEKAFLHRRGAHTLTVKSNGEGSNAQELRSLSYKGYIKLYTNYNTDTGYYEFYEISDFIHLTGSLTTSMIGNAGTSGTKDTRTGMIYHNDIVCNHASGNYAINLERLIVGQVYRFQFLTQTGYTYLYNNGTSSVSVYSGNSSFSLGPGKNANIQASSSAVASHTVSVVRMSATQIYVIWGY